MSAFSLYCGSQTKLYRTHLASGRVEAELLANVFLRDSARSVDLVAEDEEGDLVELFDGEQGIKLSLMCTAANER